MTNQITYIHFRPMLRVVGLLLLFSCLRFIVHAQSDPPIHADGWDLSFGGDGMVETGCSDYSGTFLLRNSGALHILPDDKILMFAYCDNQPTLIQYLSNGSVDTSFGTDGKVQLPINSTGSRGMPARQQDGKILIVGFMAPDNLPVIARYTADGQLDTSFGVNGLAALPMVVEWFTRLMTGIDDQILTHDDTQFARFTKDGLPDTTLNGTGYVGIADLLAKPTDDAEQALLDVEQQQDGKVLLAIRTSWIKDQFNPRTWHKVEIVRLNADGSMDHSFADNGLYFVMEMADGFTEAGEYIVALQNGQNLVYNSATRELVRLQANGVRDASFQTPPIDFDLIIEDPNGYLMFHGGYWTNRLTPSGALDTSFGQIDWNGGFRGIAFQQDGSLIVSNAATLMRNVKTKQYPAIATATPTPLPTPTPTATPLPPEQRSLALIYAVLDNNLGDDWTRLLNNIESGVHPGVDVRLLLDGPATGDAYVYTVAHDSNPYCPSIENPTCDGRYREGDNYQRFFTEDTARPHALYQFLVDSFNAYPQAPQVSLTIIGHGSGWGANTLPAQPSIWRDQNDTLGGMLWDDHTGVQSGSRSLSTLALGQALHWATTETGRTINLLYLDGCSMGMTEVAYELHDRADYLLASPNTDWATFAYDRLLPLARYDQDGRALGEAWLATEATLLRSRTGYPFTLALTDLQQIGSLTTTVSALGDALQTILPAQQPAISQAFAQSDRFDSNYDAILDIEDTYIDLRDFAGQLQTVGITDTAVLSQARAVQAVMSSVVITVAHENGSPWLAEEQTWAWQNLGGLSIYAPLHEDEAKRRIFYNQENLSWAADTTWDEFLAAFWATNSNAAATQADMPICFSTTDGCRGLANPLRVQAPPIRLLYLPLLFR